MNLEPDVFVPTEQGYWVSENQARIAEIIKDYDPTLELCWIPPERRQPGDRAFAVVHRPLGLPEYVAFYADECDERLLERIFAGDNARGNVMAAVEAKNAANKALQMKKQMDEMEEAHDIARSIVRSPLNKYKHDGVVYQ